MIPIRLLTKAFGPYAKEQVLDFRELQDRTLFLIHGPTGGGKTSILDAICFALYGVCSGAHREAKQVRSDHAEPSIPTEVTFDFSLSGEIYRVYRKPEQIRLRKDGKATTAKPEAALFRRTGLEFDHDDGSVLATQWKRVTEEVERLIGFRSDQFRQVVMLPQGEFRRLLLADSKDRQAILEVLFGTELYRRIEEALKQASREVENQIRDVEKRSKFILEQAGAESEQQLADQQAEGKSRCEEVASNLHKLKGIEKQAQQKLEQGRAAIEVLKELEVSQKAVAAHENRLEEIGCQRDALAAARRAVVVEPEARTLAARNKEADEATLRLAKAREGFEIALSDKEKAEEILKKEEQKQFEAKELRMKLGGLEGLIPRVRELDEIKKRLSKAEKDLLLKEEALERAKNALEKTRSDMEKIIPQRDLAEKTAARIEFLQLKSREVEKTHQIHVKLRELKEQESHEVEALQDADLRLTRVQTDLADALDEYKQLEIQWIEGRAAALAAKLVPGAACPVCGSKDHPKPASLEHEPPNEKVLKTKATQIDRFRALVEKTRKEKSDVEISLSRIRADSAARNEGLGDFASKKLEEIEIALKGYRKELKIAQAAGKEAENLAAQLELLEKTISEASQACSQAEQQRNEFTIGLQRLQGEHAALKGQLPEDFQEIKVLERAIAAIRKRIKLLEEEFETARQATARANEDVHAAQAALKAAEDNAAVCSKRMLVQREQFKNSLRQADFPDETAFRACLRSAAEISAMEKEIETFDRGLSAAKDRFERASLNARDVPRPDMEGLQNSANQARLAVDTAIKEEATLAARLKQIDRSLSDHEESSRLLHSLEEKYSVIGRIAQAANGVNKDGITFQRFVLAALLDDVLFAASKRFKIMTNNRFHLQRVASRADRRLPGGLDLEVHDTYTGSARPVSTLSGGESFLASLSLALGLADVVQGYAGGIHLDTIFVDEGFGSLDPESLDLALRALMDLRQEGRLVGIISHVPELTERIDARLEVTSDRNGSAARFVM